MVEPLPNAERVFLDGALTIREIDAVRGRLAAALSASASVEVDCSAAVEVDLSLIQLLIAARRSAAEAGKHMTMAQPADGALRAALIQGGFLPAEGPEAGFWVGPATAS